MKFICDQGFVNGCVFNHLTLRDCACHLRLSSRTGDPRFGRVAVYKKAFMTPPRNSKALRSALRLRSGSTPRVEKRGPVVTTLCDCLGNSLRHLYTTL